jgi:YfiH family protein
MTNLDDMNNLNQEILEDGVVESSLLTNQGIVNATSTKALGNMSISRDLDGSAQSNFANLMRVLNIDIERQSVLFPKLTHSSNVALVAAREGRTGRINIDQNSPEIVELARFEGINPPQDFIADPASGIDACISSSPDTFLAVLPADCAPVMIYDPKTGYYALAHSGVLGTFSGIVINTVNSMRQWCQTNPSDLVVYLGPCVTSKIYNLKLSGLWNKVLRDRVDADVAENFELKEYIKRQLLELGVLEANIETSRFCTGSDDQLFFSNYSAKTVEDKQKQGRHLSIVGRNKSNSN